MDLITLIVPIYNAEKYLDETIESIVKQSYSNFELILVNDGSTDNSLKICNGYKEKDRRIKVLNKKNSGVSDSRNHGIVNSNGNYICFVDADDMIKEDFLQIMYYEISSADVDVVFCNFEYNYNGKLIKKNPRLTQGNYCIDDINNELIDDGTMSGILFGSVWAAIYKRDVIDRNKLVFRKNIQTNEDGLFNIEYCLKINKIKVLSNYYLYIYRQIETSVTKNYSIKNNYSDATLEIIELCQGLEESMNLGAQLKARKVSEAFWVILKTCGKNSIKSNSYILQNLKLILNDDDLTNCYSHINLKKLSKYKFVYYLLMKKKKYRTILLLTKYIYPILSTKVTR